MKLQKIASIVLFYLLIVSVFLASAYWGSTATTVIAQRIPLERHHTVIIDAGHGGEDGGAISCTGRAESTYNLEIALRLKDLMHLLGVDTQMIRSTDTSVYSQGDTIAVKKVSDLKNRVSQVNNNENGLLLSIHQNTFTESQYSGAQVFYAPEGEGAQLAELLQNAICQTINIGSNRRSKMGTGVYLLEHIERTGVLIECGFLSNSEEEAKLRDKSYQQKLVCVIGSSVCNFLDR
jgi:N-acetylmuramoyl-L-alanine amidase